MNPDSTAAGLFAGGFILFIYLAIFALVVAVYWKICSKAGYPGWYALGCWFHA